MTGSSPTDLVTTPTICKVRSFASPSQPYFGELKKVSSRRSPSVKRIGGFSSITVSTKFNIEEATNLTNILVNSIPPYSWLLGSIIISSLSLSFGMDQFHYAATSIPVCGPSAANQIWDHCMNIPSTIVQPIVWLMWQALKPDSIKIVNKLRMLNGKLC